MQPQSAAAESSLLPTIKYNDVSQFVVHWGPRLIIAGFVGYYSLGIAYQTGLMAAIDRIAIDLLYSSVGYAGLGAIMPTVQWYTAWTVRISAAFVAGLVYDIAERIVRWIVGGLSSFTYTATREKIPYTAIANSQTPLSFDRDAGNGL